MKEQEQEKPKQQPTNEQMDNAILMKPVSKNPERIRGIQI